MLLFRPKRGSRERAACAETKPAALECLSKSVRECYKRYLITGLEYGLGLWNVMDYGMNYGNFVYSRWHDFSLCSRFLSLSTLLDHRRVSFMQRVLTMSECVSWSVLNMHATLNSRRMNGWRPIQGRAGYELSIAMEKEKCFPCSNP